MQLVVTYHHSVIKKLAAVTRCYIGSYFAYEAMCLQNAFSLKLTDFYKNYTESNMLLHKVILLQCITFNNKVANYYF